MKTSKSIYAVILFLLLAPLSVQSQNAQERVPGKPFEVLQQQIDALQQHVAELQAKLAALSINENGDMVISGINVYIQDGQGTTHCGPPFSDHDCNGKGNLIVGYNVNGDDDKSGSHNVVIGDLHTYTSYSGLVLGRNNAIINVGTSVTSGFDNEASGLYASVSGGRGHVASGNFSSISGGRSNLASGDYASVNGGIYNHAQGENSTVGGGYNRFTENDNEWAAGSLKEPF